MAAASLGSSIMVSFSLQSGLVNGDISFSSSPMISKALASLGSFRWLYTAREAILVPCPCLLLLRLCLPSSIWYLWGFFTCLSRVSSFFGGILALLMAGEMIYLLLWWHGVVTVVSGTRLILVVNCGCIYTSRTEEAPGDDWELSQDYLCTATVCTP